MSKSEPKQESMDLKTAKEIIGLVGTHRQKEKEVNSFVAALEELTEAYNKTDNLSRTPSWMIEQGGDGNENSPYRQAEAKRLGEQIETLSPDVDNAKEGLQELTSKLPSPEKQREAQALLKEELKRLEHIKDKDKTPQDKEDIAGCKKLLKEGSVPMPLQEAEAVLAQYDGAAKLAEARANLEKSTKELEKLSSPEEKTRRHKKFDKNTNRILHGITPPNELYKIPDEKLSEDIRKAKQNKTEYEKAVEKFGEKPAIKPSDELRQEAAEVFKEELANQKKDSPEYTKLMGKMNIIKPKTWAKAKLNLKSMASGIKDRLDKVKNPKGLVTKKSKSKQSDISR
jgi:hypothetical protein